MPARLIDTTCATCGTPRRVRAHLIDIYTHCQKCGNGIVARTKRKADGTSSPYKGVYYRDPSRRGSNRGRPWVARIRVNGRLRELGYYPDPESASKAYQREWRRHFGDDYEIKEGSTAGTLEMVDR